MSSENGKGAIASNNDAQREPVRQSIAGNGDRRQEVFDTLSETCRAYGITGNQVIAYVWSNPELRECMRRKFVFSECNKVRARIRNEKLDFVQRSDSAQHASQVRWQRERDSRKAFNRVDIFELLK